MAGQRCPSCGSSFQVMDDEQGMHDCPSCGYGEPEHCAWCNAEVGPDLTDAEDYPYCSLECAVRAEADSMEDCDND